MKKLLSFLLVFVMLFSVAACGNDTNVRGEITYNTPDVQQEQIKEPEPEFSLGTTVGNTYENKFIGLGIELDSDWSFKSDKEIRELNNIATDLLGDEYEEKIQDADLIYDMFAQNTTDFSNINVILEKHGKGKFDEAALLKLLETWLPEIEEMLTSMGFQDIKESYVTVTEIDGKRFPSTIIHSTIGETDFYQVQICKKVGEYLATITISSYDETTLKNITDRFYVID